MMDFLKVFLPLFIALKPRFWWEKGVFKQLLANLYMSNMTLKRSFPSDPSEAKT
jgi:hypothetical protein